MGRPSFTREGYRELLDALARGGYEPARFDASPPGEGRIVFLRHDVDKRPAAARRMAEIEAEAGWRSTYFFLLRSPLYSVLEPSTLDDIDAIRELGHEVGLHCDATRLSASSADDPFDERVVAEREVLEQVVKGDCTRAVSFHNPEEWIVGREPNSSAYVSTYAPRFMPPGTKYLSESNARWREGDPTEPIAEGRWQRLQLLVHPIWWDAESETRPERVLESVFEDRRDELEEYLSWTNDLWNRRNEG